MPNMDKLLLIRRREQRPVVLWILLDRDRHLMKDKIHQDVGRQGDGPVFRECRVDGVEEEAAPARRVASSSSKQPLIGTLCVGEGSKILDLILPLLTVLSVRAIAKLFKMFFGTLGLVVGEERPHCKTQIVEELSSLNDCE